MSSWYGVSTLNQKWWASLRIRQLVVYHVIHQNQSQRPAAAVSHQRRSNAKHRKQRSKDESQTFDKQRQIVRQSDRSTVAIRERNPFDLISQIPSRDKRVHGHSHTPGQPHSQFSAEAGSSFLTGSNNNPKWQENYLICPSSQTINKAVQVKSIRVIILRNMISLNYVKSNIWHSTEHHKRKN